MSKTDKYIPNRIVDLPEGWLYVVSDLHGAWNPYTEYRTDFLRLHEQGRADAILFLGDLIHGYGEPEEDFSLDIVWDIIQLQETLGPNRVIALLGNHETASYLWSNALQGQYSDDPAF